MTEQAQRAQEMFDYMTSVRTRDLRPADGALVFGRLSLEVARAAYSLHTRELIGYAMFTGGVGKDSGILAREGVAEASWLAGVSAALGMPAEKVYTETKATIGAENCRLGLDAIVRAGLPHGNLILVAHATQLRRLVGQFEAMLHFGRTGLEPAPEVRIQAVPDAYKFDPEDAADRLEAAHEIVKLADWPKEQVPGEPGFKLLPQPDLPAAMVKQAREMLGE